MVRTTDGGTTWTSQTHGSSAALRGVIFVTAEQAYAVGENGTILKSTDAGITWTIQASNETAGLNAVSFSDENTGTAVGNNGTILRTTNGGTTSVHDKFRLPVGFRLEQNYANPFNPSTTIRYALPHASEVTLTVFNTLGQQVAELVKERKDAGENGVKFSGGNLTSGVYFYRLQAGNYVDTKKLVLTK